jgi:hypothetical protein
MRRALDLGQDAKTILDEIEKTLHVEVREQVGTFNWIENEGPVQANPGGLTALQVLCEKERATAFNQTDDEAPDYFVHAIQDFMIAHNGKTPTRKVRETARSAWRENLAADRRIREREPISPGEGFRSPNRGRPEIYPPDVVWAFADAIARAAGCENFSIGHHGDATITDKNKGGGAMFRCLVAAVRWAMTVAWLAAARPGTAPPIIKPEGILTLIKRGR